MEIHTEAQFNSAIQLRRYINANFFLGATDTEVEGNWVWDSSEEVVRLDVFWHGARPFVRDDLDCAAMFRDGMFDYHCTAPYKAVCEFN